MNYSKHRKGRLVRHAFRTNGHPANRLKDYNEMVAQYDKDYAEALAAPEAKFPEPSEHPGQLDAFLADRFECQSVEPFLIPDRWEVIHAEWNTDAGEVFVTYFIPDGA